MKFFTKPSRPSSRCPRIGCVKMRASLQWNELFIVNASFFEVRYAFIEQLKEMIQIIMFYRSYSNILVKLRQPAIWVLSFFSIQGFLLRYKTLSYVIWLKNGRLSKFDKNIGIWLVKHYDLYLFLSLSTYAYYTSK